MKSQQPWHQRFGPVRAARSAARRTFFRVLRKTFATDDGRAILNESLHGQLEWRPRAALTGVNLDDQVYGELGRLSAAVVDRRPVIITARFRTTRRPGLGIRKTSKVRGLACIVGIP